jgi:parallel beta-helix repeat protein
MLEMLFIDGNELFESYQGIVVTDYLNCSIKNNIVRDSHAVGPLRVSNGNGDYSIIEGNIIINSWSVVNPAKW